MVPKQDKSLTEKITFLFQISMNIQIIIFIFAKSTKQIFDYNKKQNKTNYLHLKLVSMFMLCFSFAPNVLNIFHKLFPKTHIPYINYCPEYNYQPGWPKRIVVVTTSKPRNWFYKVCYRDFHFFVRCEICIKIVYNLISICKLQS